MNNAPVTITVRLPRPLWSALRSKAEQETTPNGRASVSGLIVRRLEREFTTSSAAAKS